MTTTVTVTTHSWPVAVRTFPCANGQPVAGANWSDPTEVSAHSQQIFHVHSGADLLIQELPLPKDPPLPDLGRLDVV
jgi:hypothetical protein